MRTSHPDPLHAESLEECYNKRELTFIHHFAGPNDPLTAAVKPEAEKEKVKIKCISCEKSKGTGNLLENEPYSTHLRWARKGYVDAYYSCRLSMQHLFKAQVQTGRDTGGKTTRLLNRMCPKRARKIQIH